MVSQPRPCVRLDIIFCHTLLPLTHPRTFGSVNQVLREHHHYLEVRLTRANSRIKEELERIVASRQRKKSEVSRKHDEKEELSNLLVTMPLEDLSTYINNQTSGLASAKAGLEEKRSQGFHKVSAKAQKFMLEFDRFLDAYSGIVNVVKLVDAQYGGVASATLAILFSTVKIKAKDEDAITGAMQQMSDRLPAFETYRKIYPDPALGSMLVDAYKDVILFAREATLYFMGSTLGRQLTSLGKPLQFESMEQSMRNNFNRIRLRCEVLLAQQVDHLVGELEEMQKRNDSSIVVESRNALQLGNYRPDEATRSLDQYRQLLASIFDHDRHRAKFCIADLLAHEVGRGWQEHGSCVFMLSGRNESGVSSTESWLSPVTVDLTLGLLEENRKVAFEMCEATSALEVVLSRLIFQLLEKNPAVVRKAEDWYPIQSLISQKGDEREVALPEALLKVIDLQKEPVFIVLNRPETCDMSSVKDFALIMLHLVERAVQPLKVLIVHRAELWDWEENKRGILGQRRDPEKCRVLRIDQQRL
ncbi:hypothetical protein BKA66DRAFT_605371 [Pyrenochaeta sp. MPI-SDFR-AT-0127]|nr:hypothetical protein BKA66DRAFT_605371 [Pyrenochaeta sp. MPI-SDFR-AT-0127]